MISRSRFRFLFLLYLAFISIAKSTFLLSISLCFSSLKSLEAWNWYYGTHSTHHIHSRLFDSSSLEFPFVVESNPSNHFSNGHHGLYEIQRERMSHKYFPGSSRILKIGSCYAQGIFCLRLYFALVITALIRFDLIFDSKKFFIPILS